MADEKEKEHEIISVPDAIRELALLKADTAIWDDDQEATTQSPSMPRRFPFRLFFRGQGSNEEWRAHPVPGVFREGTGEDKSYQEETSLYHHFQMRMADYHEKYRTPFDWLCLMQHYELPTRLLDWSESILAALYFAVRREKHDKKDGTLFVLHGGRLNKLNSLVGERIDGKRQPSLHTPTDFDVLLRASMSVFKTMKDVCSNLKDSPLLRNIRHREDAEKIINAIREKESVRLDNDGEETPYETIKQQMCSPIAVFPNRLDGRMITQSSLITIHGGKKYFDNDNDKEDRIPAVQHLKDCSETYTKKNPGKILLTTYRIPWRCKQSIREELREIGIHSGTLYPELDHQSQYVEEQWTYPLNVSSEEDRKKKLFKDEIARLGIDPSDKQIDVAYQRFQDVVGGETAEDFKRFPINIIRAVVEEVVNDVASNGDLPRFMFGKCALNGKDTRSAITVKDTYKGSQKNPFEFSCEFTLEPNYGYLKGAFEAVRREISKTIKAEDRSLLKPTLRLHEVKGITHGANDYASAVVAVENLETRDHIGVGVGYGVDQSVINASIRAYISAVSKLLKRPAEPAKDPYTCESVTSKDDVSKKKAEAAVVIIFRQGAFSMRIAKPGYATGHIGAAFQAVDACIGRKDILLTSYEVHGYTKNEGGEIVVKIKTTIKLKGSNECWTGDASGPDIVKVSVDAYLSAINRSPIVHNRRPATNPNDTNLPTDPTPLTQPQ